MSRGGSRGLALGLLAASAILGFVATVEPATGLAILSLATIPALFAVPPRGRFWLGLVVIAIAGAVAVLGDLGRQAPAWAAVGGVVVAGVVIAARGRRWPPFGGRYDASSEVFRSEDPGQLWRALDRGEDPTGPDSPEPTKGDHGSPDASVD